MQLNTVHCTHCTHYLKRIFYRRTLSLFSFHGVCISILLRSFSCIFQMLFTRDHICFGCASVTTYQITLGLEKKATLLFFFSEKRVFSVGCKWINKCWLFEQHQIFKTLIYTLSRSRTIWIYIIIIFSFLFVSSGRCCFQFEFLSIHLTTLYIHFIPLICEVTGAHMVSICFECISVLKHWLLKRSEATNHRQ